MRYLPPKIPLCIADAYKRDLIALPMAICQNSMFDLSAKFFLAPFRFNADGQENPYFTDERKFLRKATKGDRDYDWISAGYNRRNLV